jgi:hypothetical protein
VDPNRFIKCRCSQTLLNRFSQWVAVVVCGVARRVELDDFGYTNHEFYINNDKYTLFVIGKYNGLPLLQVCFYKGGS